MDERKAYLCPERRLMLAVLREAVACLGGARGDRSSRKARAWVLSRDKRYIFSFECICETLEWDPGQARRHLLSQQGTDDGAAPARRARRQLDRVLTIVVTDNGGEHPPSGICTPRERIRSLYEA